MCLCVCVDMKDKLDRSSLGLRPLSLLFCFVFLVLELQILWTRGSPTKVLDSLNDVEKRAVDSALKMVDSKLLRNEELEKSKRRIDGDEMQALLTKIQAELVSMRELNTQMKEKMLMLELKIERITQQNRPAKQTAENKIIKLSSDGNEKSKESSKASLKMEKLKQNKKS